MKLEEMTKEEWLERGGDPRWFDEFKLTGGDICALVQAGTLKSMWGAVILDHPAVEKIVKDKRIK